MWRMLYLAWIQKHKRTLSLQRLTNGTIFQNNLDCKLSSLRPEKYPPHRPVRMESFPIQLFIWKMHACFRLHSLPICLAHLSMLYFIHLDPLELLLYLCGCTYWNFGFFYVPNQFHYIFLVYMGRNLVRLKIEKFLLSI